VIGLVTLDFWQTLFADTADSQRRAHILRLEGVRETLAEAGRLYTAAEVASANARAVEGFIAVWREHRDMTAAEQLRIFLGVLDPTLPVALDATMLDRVARAYQEPALTHRPAITPAAAEAVREIRARGLTLGVISNTGRTPGRVVRRLLEDAGLLACFDVLVFSDEAGVRKPAAAIFRRMLDQTGVDPAGAVHVGDDPVTDVAALAGSGCGPSTTSPSRLSRRRRPTASCAGSRSCRSSSAASADRRAHLGRGAVAAPGPCRYDDPTSLWSHPSMKGIVEVK
jgi:putative hydrolase of the HAD superfamily